MPPSSSEVTRYAKPRVNLYTALLLIALVAMILGLVSLYFVMADYKFELKAPTVVGCRQSWMPSVGCLTAVEAAEATSHFHTSARVA